MKEWIQQYVKGCGVCQQSKTNTRPQKPPLYPITPKEGAAPFSTIAMDWITKLPPSSGYDSILTITDHDCSKAALFFPCKESMGTEGLAKLYFTKVFPHYGIPNKIISDRDPRLTLRLAKEICHEAGIDQNISTAYHPQTDGQSERTNQTLETYLRIFCNEQQNDWARWIPLAQYTLNSRPSHTTKVPPFEALIGVVPKAQITPLQSGVPLNERKELLTKIRKKKYDAILHSQMLMIKETSFRTYQKGEKVWLDAKNLKTTHPTHKLRVKRYGPFKVIDVLSHVAYQLQLPKTWKIHNVFHASYLSPYKETKEHGTNFFEPPPDIIEGQPEWEVESIVGMRHFGRKKEKQYRVHWKGYSEAEDTWEPEANINAPELIAKYHQTQGMNIRATRTRAEGSMFSGSHQAPPEQEEVSLPQSPLSAVSNPELTKLLSEATTGHILPRVTTRLEQVAQTRTLPKVVLQTQTFAQDRSQEPTRTGEEEREALALHNLGTEAPDHKAHTYSPLRENLSRQEPPQYRSEYPSNTQEAARSEQLLRRPVVNHISALGNPRPAMGDTGSTVPDPPWFAKPRLPEIPTITAVDDHGQTIELPYMRYALIDDEPMLLGTTDRTGAVYGDYLRAFPMPNLPFESNMNDTVLEELYTDHPFNWNLNLALYHMGDTGVIADVHRYRSSYLKLKYMRRENERITRILEHIQKEQVQHNTELLAFVEEVSAIRERLIKARVLSHVAPIF